MKTKKLLMLLSSVALILEALPFGAVLNFATPDGESTRKTFSYFSLTPYGYANFAPLITAICTCIVFILLLLYCLTDKKTPFTVAKYFLIIGAVLSLCPLFFGFASFSIVGGLISATLISELIIIFCSEKIQHLNAR